MKDNYNTQTFVQRMEQFITEEQLISAESTVCCALSGGADSVALLLGLLALKNTLSIQITAVHVNHHLRGAESDADAQFCRDLCKKLDVPLQVYHCDVKGYQEENGISMETAARECRYSCFEQETGMIATAHTASDNLETIVHRIARGTGLHGLTGIPVRRGRFVRPILFAQRSEVEAFLRAANQEYVTDSSNISDDYTRNRIRHHIIPQLQELNPSVEETVTRMCRSLRTDDQFLENEAEQAFCTHFRDPARLKKLSEIPEAVRVRCIIRLLELHGISYDAKMLHKLEQLAEKGGRYQLNHGFSCRVSKDEMILVRHDENPEIVKRIPMKIGSQSLYERYTVEISLICGKKTARDFIVNEKFAKCLLDYDKIIGNVIVRSRIPGDRIQPAGRDFTVSIKKRIQEEIPLHRRSTLHFLEDEAGTIYAEGIGVAERVKAVADETERLLMVRICRNGEEASYRYEKE